MGFAIQAADPKTWEPSDQCANCAESRAGHIEINRKLYCNYCSYCKNHRAAYVVLAGRDVSTLCCATCDEKHRRELAGE